jgi:integrase
MRQGEVRALMWGDINFKDHLIYVRAELEGAKKNKTSRDVPMLPIVEKLLLEWRDADWRDKKPETLEWVFPSLKPQKIEELKNKPDRLSDSTVSTAFKRVVDQVISENPTIKPITFHDLRHWGCTRLAPFHNDALDLAKTTGHKSIKMLQRYYNPDPVSRAVRIRAKAAELFSKTK